MTAQQIILLVINIIGGIAVIGSYILGLNAQSGGANVLWGGVPAGIRPVYFVSMLLSALGYFAFIYFILFRLVPADVTIAGKFGYSLFYIIFVLMLLPSAAWMPLSNLYVTNGGTGIWLGIRIVLFIVGLASASLVWALLTLNTKLPAVPYWLAVAGAAYFTAHTLILDAIVWAALF
ncbi:MAG: hypothetical protein JW712_13310 [Dehalococcoidales bacterium]|nr:hypothetical protein [Dehalococcoidales bacterium]